MMRTSTPPRHLAPGASCAGSIWLPARQAQESVLGKRLGRRAFRQADTSVERIC